MARSATVRASKASAAKPATSAAQNERPLQGVTDAAFASLMKMGLGQYVAELENFGYTVVPPELSGASDLLKPLLKAISRISAERNNGTKPDFKTGASHSEGMGPAGQHLFFLLGEDPVFQQAMMNPVVVNFVKYLMPDPIISSVTSMLKGPGIMPLQLHSDQPIQPIPRSLVCNTTYLLSDYTRDNGALCFVPGSHKLMRNPGLAENFHELMRNPGLAENFSLGDLSQKEVGQKLKAGELTIKSAPNAKAVEAKKGSLVIWHGNTWHGAFNRTNAGLRVNLIVYWCSASLRPQEPYREQLSDAVIKAGGEEFAQLIGRGIHHGWMSEGPERTPGAAFERHRKRGSANSGS